MEKYRYSTLSEGQMRVVHVDPAQHRSDPISIRLHVVDVAAKPGLDALSYVWGEKSGTIPVVCDQGQLLITPNLQTALRWLRSADRVRTFWIDAVCINQEDFLERNEQVKLMRQIYEMASQVIVWLGEPRTQDSTAGETPLTLSLAYKIMQYNIATEAPIFAGAIDAPSLEKELSHLENIPELAARALHSLISYPWFSRMWIIQEAAVNKNTTVVCGEDQIDWAEFSSVVQTTSNIEESEVRYIERNDVKRCAALVSVKNIVHDAEHPEGDGRDCQVEDILGHTSLSSLLAFTQLFSATDARDKIYALLGLAQDVVVGEADLQPDYRLPIEEIYRRFARFIIAKERRLDILHRVGVHRALTMPSWVPDWSVETNEGRLPLDAFPDWDAESEPDDQARGAQKYRVIVRESSDPNILILQGKKFGIIQHTGPALAAQSGLSSFAEDWAQVGPEWERLAADIAMGEKDQRKLRTYIETVTARRQKRQGVHWRRDGFVTWYMEYGEGLFPAPEDEVIYAKERSEHNNYSDDTDSPDGSDEESENEESDEEDGDEDTEKSDGEKDNEDGDGDDSKDDADNEDSDGSDGSDDESDITDNPKDAKDKESDSDAKSEDSEKDGSTSTESPDDWSYEAPQKSETLRERSNEVEEASYGRRFIVTDRGRMGLAPRGAGVGDSLVFFGGSGAVFVVREAEGVHRDGDVEKEKGDKRWLIIGDCYIPRFDVVKLMRDPDVEMERFMIC